MNPPLDGIRVLSLEQAVALPAGTRHLADLGADVIRVQSHRRARGGGGIGGLDLLRSKRQLAIDLEAEGGPELFVRLAAECDVVAHNFTPRVVKKFGIDYERIREANPRVIYLSLTGFGMTGPWGPRPLFGPGAEAVSGHNSLIGDPESWPGRPGTIVYADNITGMYAAFAVLAALDHRDRTGEGQHIDLSLYESCVSHLGPVLAERQLGAEPARSGNADAGYAIHEVFEAAGTDRHVALAARNEELPAVARALGLELATADAVAERLATMTAEAAAEALQEHGVAATVVADASDVATDPHLGERGYWAWVAGEDGVERPHTGPPWGGASFTPAFSARPVGTDNANVLADVLGLTEDEIRAYEDRGVVGRVPDVAAGGGPPAEVRISRGELSRVDEAHHDWSAHPRPAPAPGGIA